MKHFSDELRIQCLFHDYNSGVGGAVISGYRYAFNSGADIVVKVDGDGQMPLSNFEDLVAPLLKGQADFSKGNRFFNPRQLSKMPSARLIGNAGLSFICKFSSGYWSIMDPTNGYVALHRTAFAYLEPDKLARDYFFESDLLYQLGIARAVVVDIPMPVIYGNETSSLSIWKALLRFPGRLLVRFAKRLIYTYFIRDFSIASLELLLGIPLFATGVLFGLYKWLINSSLGVATPAGPVMITGLLILIGFQLLLSAINYDIVHEPRTPLQSLDRKSLL
jgi:glycosyltransferase involved in cell wall biosynthesis